MSDTIFNVIFSRLTEWPKIYPEGQLDLVSELIQIQGRIVISVSIGASYADQELPYVDPKTGETNLMPLGNFMNDLISTTVTRQQQLPQILLHELLEYTLTANDRIQVKNYRTLIDFFRKIKAEKLE